MGYSSGYVAMHEGWQHLEVIAQSQQVGVARELASGACIPAWSVPDHINLDGSAVFFPGTYAADETQGGEPWGLRPPANNHFDFIWLAWMLVADGLPIDRLALPIAGVSLIDRLERAFHAVDAEPVTEMVVTTPETRRVGMIFYDSVYFTGRLLAASVLRFRAARQLAALLGALGRPDDALPYRTIAIAIADGLGKTFAREDLGGWLAASTGVSAQADVWGTLMALHYGLLDEGRTRAALNSVVRSTRDGSIVFEGAVRHVPTDRDATDSSAWERTVTPHNVYQNGAYWHTATGWLIDALMTAAPERAAQVLHDFIAHLRRHDFRKGDAYGGPWECIGPNLSYYRGPIFHPSITQTMGVLRFGILRAVPA